MIWAYMYDSLRAREDCVNHEFHAFTRKWSSAQKIHGNAVVGAQVPWIDNDWFETYMYQLRQSTTNEGFDPGMCCSDPTSMIVRLADVS